MPRHSRPIKCNRFQANQIRQAKLSQAPKYLLVVNLNFHSPLHRGDNVHCRVISFVLSLFTRYHAGTFSPALRAHGWQCPQLSGANSDRDLSLDPLAVADKLTSPQRSTTSSSKDAASEAAASPFRLTVAATATTAIAIGSMAWYYHLYGPTLYAMTPQEEGYNRFLGRILNTVLKIAADCTPPNTRGNMRSSQRPSTTKRKPFLTQLLQI